MTEEVVGMTVMLRAGGRICARRCSAPRNLISQGIPPLRFKDESDYGSFEQGQKRELPEIRERLKNGAEAVPLRKVDG
jgi:hypothetical protein